jgi:hypothetical protein
MEGECFDEFLDCAAELPLIAPVVYALGVWEGGFEEGGDLREARGCFFCDVWWEGLVYCSDSFSFIN